MNKLFTTLIYVLVFASCNNNKAYLILKMKEPTMLYGQTKEFEASLPSQVEFINSNLYFFRVNGCAAKIFNEKDGTNIADFGRMGPGPDEFISPFFAGYDEKNNRMYINDISLNIRREYEIIKKEDTLLFKKHNTIDIIKNDLVFRSAIYLKNGYMVAQVISGTNKLFILFDSNMSVLHTFGDNPIGAETTILHPLSGYLTANKNQFVFVAMHCGYIVSYDISDNGDVTKLWEHYLSNPDYDLDGSKIKWNVEKNKLGFFDVKMNDKHIYTLYSGKEDTETSDRIPRNLLVFDLKGNLEHNYLLDKQCGRLAIANDSIIYALYSNPDVGIAKYTLRH